MKNIFIYVIIEIVEKSTVFWGVCMKNKRFFLLTLLLLTSILCVNITSCDPNNKPSHEKQEDFNSNTSVLEHDHVYKLKVLVSPSCGVEGEKAYVCEICGKKQYKTSIAALNHEFQYDSILSTPPKCTTNGLRVEKCKNCGDIRESVSLAQGHNWYPTVSCDSNTNELVIISECTHIACNSKSTYEYRYKIDDVKKLVGEDYIFAELDRTIISGTSISYMQKAPYYGVYCSSTYLLIVRNTKSFPDYELGGINGTPKNHFKACGCTIVFEKNISIDKDGRIQIEQ